MHGDLAVGRILFGRVEIVLIGGVWNKWIIVVRKNRVTRKYICRNPALPSSSFKEKSCLSFKIENPST